MKYAIIAAVAAVAVAAPAEWDPVKTTTPEWEPVKTTTTSDWEYKPTTTAEWEPVKKTTTSDWETVKKTTTYEWEPVKTTTTKCSTVSTYTTKVYNNKDNEWEGYSYATKYTTLYPEKCPAPTTSSYVWEPVKPTTTKCSTVSTYTTKVFNNKDNEWEGYSYVTKYTTLYPTACPTPAKSTETWVPYTTSSKASETPVKGVETWSAYTSTSKAPVAASTSAWSPVATFKGAADKSTFGMGALAIAAVAALL